MATCADNSSAAFDPARPGTPESAWDAAFVDAPALALPGSPMLVVSPHPDDEVLGTGGLICSAARAGHAVNVLSVTDGEAAYPDWHGLGGLRRSELRAALSALTPHNMRDHLNAGNQLSVRNQHGVRAEHLRIPDGHVENHRESLFAAIEARLTPDSVLVAPYEQDGHPDHDATGEVCRGVAKLHGLTLWRYPIWLWHHGTPRELLGQPIGRFALDADARKAKARAMSCFTSQLRPLGREPIVPSHVLAYFTRPYEIYLT